MNCNCISEKEKEVFDSLQNHPKFSDKLESVRLANAGVAVTDNLSLKAAISIPFLVKADVPGYRQRNGKELPFFAKFCPFCGTSTAPQETEKTA